ncbi:MAG: isopeptide-forming domain-containing fimbrial protein [Firmicutes bacterium]|nr:isopeptide-forming domain-containing fimbrial protein [Bacillota bacterium]
MKRLFALLLTLMMVASLSINAFAAEEKGSITINGVSTDTTYEIYKLLDLESYNKETGAYSYKVNATWTNFFATDEAKAYFTIDEAGYATWTAAEDDSTVAAFAKLALAYAKENSIAPTKSSENDGEFVITETTGKFSDLELGYYLVDSTMGALCGLTTTNPDASINAKNGIPTIEKQVQEDSTEQWGNNNTADIGQIVKYRVTINVHPGAENYVLHDTVAPGLTFEHDPENKPYPNDPDLDKSAIFRGVWKIEHVIPSVGTHVVPDKMYTVVNNNLDDDCTFEVHFTKDFCDELQTNDKVIVHYNAMLNRNAVVGNTENKGNDNTAWLTFGEGGKSNKDTVTTYTYGIDIVKTDSQNTLIDGAEFRIYDAATGGNEVAVVQMDDGVTYRRARADETGVPIVVKDGKVRVVGFDNGTYHLEEIVTPVGYNQLAGRQTFIIADANLDATFNGDIYSTGSGVHVVNKTGTMLPETGGMGTVLFVTIGMMVALAAGVLLVTKKRMSMIQD